MRAMALAAAIAVVTLMSASASRAQDVPATPRPRLDNGADTNSAQNYFNYGMKAVYEHPADAAHAFYWASRLDPESGDALYALRAATILAMPRDSALAYFENGYVKKNKKDEAPPRRTPGQLALDSMLVHAYAIDPFVFASLDPTLMRRFIQADVMARNPHMSEAGVDIGIMSMMRSTANQAWLNYAQGRFPEALAMYARVLTDSGPRAKGRDSTAIVQFRELVTSEVHAQRGRIFYLLGDLDSARIEISAALASMRERDSRELVMLYQSKAVYQHALGIIYERQKQYDLARDAYGQALQEDLSYYAAHSHLAQLELAKGDTSTALSEMDVAIQLQPGDPVLRYRYADVLVHARRDGDAAVQLRKAIALDPDYGAPHLLFARIADVEQYTDDAIDEYRKYLAVAARTDKQLLVARARLAELTSAMASTPTKP